MSRMRGVMRKRFYGRIGRFGAKSPLRYKMLRIVTAVRRKKPVRPYLVQCINKRCKGVREMSLISRTGAGNLGGIGEAVLFAVAFISPFAAFWSMLSS